MCGTNGYTWNVSELRCENSVYIDLASCTKEIRSWVNHNSKNNCNLSGQDWSVTTKNLKLKINGIVSDNSPSIIENGLSQLITFTFTNKIRMGESSIEIDYLPSIDDLTHPNQCINTGNHLNFIEANCINYSGIWLNDGTEQYCSGMTTATSCTGVTSPQLGGSLRVETLRLLPKTTLPVINW